MYRIAILFNLVFMVAVSSGQDTDSNAQPFREKLLPALFNQGIQKELQLARDQQEKIREKFNGLMQVRNRISRQLTKLSRSGISKKKLETQRNQLLAELESEKQKIKKDALGILEPEQVKQLHQVTAQVVLKELHQNGNQLGLLSNEMKKYLAIDGKQQQRLADRNKELLTELEAKIRKLKEETSRKLLDELTEDQKQKYLELVGEPIKLMYR